MAKKTLRWKSRSNREVVAAVSLVVYCGVRMNLKPKPRTDLAIGGTILFGVRSWKASVEGLKNLDAGVAATLATAF